MKKTWIALLLALCMLTTLGAAPPAARPCCAEPSGYGRDPDHGRNLPLHDGRQGRGRLPARERHVRRGLHVHGWQACMQDGMRAEVHVRKECACERACARRSWKC